MSLPGRASSEAAAETPPSIMVPATSGRWTAVLLLLMMWTVSAALTGIARGLEGTSSTLIVVLALALGWALARSGQPDLASAGLAGWVGSALISLRIGQLGDEFGRLAGSLIKWIAALLGSRAISSGLIDRGAVGAEAPPLEPIAQAFSALLSAYRVLLERSWAWLLELIGGGAAVDPVASAMAWSLLLWVAAFWAAWWTWRRSRPLVAAIPAQALLGTTLYLSRSSHAYLLPTLGATLLLLATAGHDDRFRRWTAQRIAHPQGLLGSLALTAVPVTLLLVAAAAAAPDLSLRAIREFGRRAGGRPVAVSGGLPDQLGLNRAGRPGTGFEPMLIAGLPNRHLIGSGPELSKRPVMTITVTNPPSDSAPGYRWRALTYDRYNGRGWQTSSLAIQAFDAGEASLDEFPRTARLVRQSVQALGELDGLAYAAGETIAVDQEFDLAWRELGLDLFAATLDEPQYVIESLLPEVTPAELRATGVEYPDWVLERYLDLPPEVPQRVLSLARQLTATGATPYDRALALEEYLRAIPYTLDLPAPPSDRDLVDYFLFDLQRGYCDYYASAMAVLARAAGLPARLVVGYFTGQATPTEGTVSYLVTEADAHAWVELYFPDIGWVEFEPTGGRPAIARPAEFAPETAPDEPELRLTREIRSQRWVALRNAGLRGIGLVALAALFGGTALVVRDSIRLRRLSPTRAIATLYLRLFSAVDRLVGGLAPGSTPHELLGAYAVHMAGQGWSGTLLRSGQPHVRQLVEAQIVGAFEPRAAQPADQAGAKRAWRRLLPRLWLAWLLSSILSAQPTAWRS